MAPLPKRKHSKMRKGKRMAERNEQMTALVECKNCHSMKLPHRLCKKCGK